LNKCHLIKVHNLNHCEVCLSGATPLSKLNNHPSLLHFARLHEIHHLIDVLQLKLPGVDPGIQPLSQNEVETPLGARLARDLCADESCK